MRKEFNGITYNSVSPGHRRVEVNTNPDGSVSEENESILKRLLKRPGYRKVTVVNQRGGSQDIDLGSHTGRKEAANALEQLQQGVEEIDDDTGWAKRRRLQRAVLEHQTEQKRSGYIKSEYKTT